MYVSVYICFYCYYCYYSYCCVHHSHWLPWHLCCPRLWLWIIAGKSTCGGSMASPGKPTRKAVTMMGSNDFIVGRLHGGTELLAVYLAHGQVRLDSLWHLTLERENSDFRPCCLMLNSFRQLPMGYGTPLLTLSFFGTWILPLHAVFFPPLFCLQSPSAMELWMTGAGSG